MSTWHIVSTSKKYRAAEQRSLFADRFAELESSTNRSPLFIKAMMKNIEHRLDATEAGSLRYDQVTHRRKQEERAGRKIHEEYTDHSEEEDPRMHVCQTKTRARTSLAHRQKHTAASFYTRTLSIPVDMNVKEKSNG